MNEFTNTARTEPLGYAEGRILCECRLWQRVGELPILPRAVGCSCERRCEKSCYLALLCDCIVTRHHDRNDYCANVLIPPIASDQAPIQCSGYVASARRSVYNSLLLPGWQAGLPCRSKGSCIVEKAVRTTTQIAALLVLHKTSVRKQ